MFFVTVAITSLIQGISTQRGFYGGTSGQGYKDKFRPQTMQQEVVGDRFQGNIQQVTQPAPVLPVNAHGDQQLFDRLSQLPREHQPFWFLNYQQLEAQRGQPFPQAQNNINQQAQSFANNPINNRFSASQPFSNSPYPIVQGVPNNLGFI